MENTFENELDEIITQGVESSDVRGRDQLLLIVISTIPFILATVWYFAK